MSLDQIAWVNFQDVIDDRGRLTAIEENVHIPFSIARIFYVHQVVSGVDRAGHAHRDTDQVVAGIHGFLKMDVSDGTIIKTYVLDNPGKGLFVPKMVWIRLYTFSQDAVCLVLANTKYDRSKSIRTWKEYLEVRGLPCMEEPNAGALGENMGIKYE
jgi:hypothetical protein